MVRSSMGVNPPAPPATTDATVGVSFLKLGLGEAVARLIAFGVAVYLARTLGTAVYGIIVLATSVVLYLSVVTDCGVGFLGVRIVAAGQAPLAETVRTVLGARLLVGIVAIAITTAMAFALLPVSEAGILTAYSLTLVTVALGTRWLHVGLGQPGKASIGRIVSEVVTAAAILGVVHGPSDVAIVPIAQLLGEGIGAVVLMRQLPAALRRLRVALRPAVVPALLRESWPLVLHALLGLAIFNSDLLFLRAFRDSASVGIYAAAYALISFCLNLGAAYTMSLLPVITRVRDDPPTVRALYDQSMAQVLAGSLPVAVGGFLVAAPLIKLIFGSDYGAAAIPLQVLVWSLPVALVRNVAQGALLAYERQREMMRAAAWAAGAAVVLNVALIPRWGLAGAAIATLATEALRTVLALVFVRRLGIRMPAPKRFVRIVVAVVAMGMIVRAVGHLNVVLTIAIGVLSYVVALVAIGGVRVRRGALPELVP